jgi:hypothetical protein
MEGLPDPRIVGLLINRVLRKDIIKDKSGILAYMGMINTMVHLQKGRAVIHRINPQNSGKDFKECLKKGWDSETPYS